MESQSTTGNAYNYFHNATCELKIALKYAKKGLI